MPSRTLVRSASKASFVARSASSVTFSRRLVRSMVSLELYTERHDPCRKGPGQEVGARVGYEPIGEIDQPPTGDEHDHQEEENREAR